MSDVVSAGYLSSGLVVHFGIVGLLCTMMWIAGAVHVYHEANSFRSTERRRTRINPPDTVW